MQLPACSIGLATSKPRDCNLFREPHGSIFNAAVKPKLCAAFQTCARIYTRIRRTVPTHVSSLFGARSPMHGMCSARGRPSTRICKVFGARSPMHVSSLFGARSPMYGMECVRHGRPCTLLFFINAPLYFMVLLTRRPNLRVNYA